MLKTRGYEIVYLDATHSVNKYGFNLFVLLVKDESGKGYPVAFNISSSLANESIESLLRWCFEESGVSPKYCMVDAVLFLFRSEHSMQLALPPLSATSISCNPYSVDGQSR